MKKLSIVFISVLIIVLCIFIAIMFCESASNAPKPIVEVGNLAQEKIWDIFLKNGELYCINTLGELYIREDAGILVRMTIIHSYGGNIYIRKNASDKLIHIFPTREVRWSDKYRAFLYYDQGNIFSYDPSKNTTKKLFEVKLEYKASHRNNIFDTIDKYVFLNLDGKSYKIDLETADVLPLIGFVDYVIAKNNDIILYKLYEDNTIICYEFTTNKEYKISNKDFYNDINSSIDIKSACIVDDMLHFIKSDGQIYSIKIRNEEAKSIDDTLYFTNSDGQIYGVKIRNEEAKNIEIFPRDSDITKRKVIAMEWAGENFLCVLLNFNKDNGVKTLSVCELYPDGTYDIIRKDDEIYYGTLDIPCTIKIQRQRYAYLVKTDDLVVFGWTFDRFN